MKRTDYELRNLVSEGRRLQDKFQTKGRVNEAGHGHFSSIEDEVHDETFKQALKSPVIKGAYNELLTRY